MKAVCAATNNDDSDRKPVIVIVDGFMTGNTIADEARKRGLSCINVTSSSTIPAILQKNFVAEKFVEQCRFDGSVEAIVEPLRRHSVMAVLPGAETAVELSEMLAFELGLPANDPTTTYRRRNKYAMIEVLRDAGLHTAEQCLASQASDIMSWKDRLRIPWPIVVKPVDSAGTDGVTFCYHEADVVSAVDAIVGKMNVLGKKNTCALAQSFLSGVEYVVNTLSWNGIHGVTDMWHYEKKNVRGAGKIYDKDELIHPSGDVQDALIEYALKALDVLGVRYGPSHCEVVMTPGGPALVELGARVQGSINVAFMKRCIGQDQLNQTLDLYRDQELNDARLLCPARLIEHGVRVEMISESDAIMHDRAGFAAALEALPSYFMHHLSYQEREPISRTVDLANTPGEVLLVHEDQERIQADYATLRRLEKRHFISR